MRVAVLTADSREHYKNYVPSIPSFGAAPTALLEGFQHLPNVEIHVISCLQKPVKSPEKLAANLWYHGLFVPKIGWLRTGYQGCVRATRRKIREIRADIVHGQGTERDCSLSAILSGRPNVVTIHGNMVSVAKVCGARMGSFNWWAARLEDFTLRRTAGVFCNSAYTESLVRPRARQTWRVPNAVRSAFLSTPAPRAARAVPMLLNIGEVCAYKRQRNVLEVARNLWRQGLRFELNFIGVADRAGAYATEFLNELREAEAAGYARHRGLLGLEQLMGVLDEASALIHFPSEESFGLVVAEALARNLKLFTAATGGLVDIAERVEGAEIYPADDWKGLEAGIARWISAGHPRPSSAADVIRERYRPERIAERHLEIYAEVLKGGAGRF